MSLPKLLRFNDLRTMRVVTNWPTLRRWIDEQGFPPGLMVGPNTRAWTEDSVAEWLASRPAADAPDGGRHASAA